MTDKKFNQLAGDFCVVVVSMSSDLDTAFWYQPHFCGNGWQATIAVRSLVSLGLRPCFPNRPSKRA